MKKAILTLVASIAILPTLSLAAYTGDVVQYYNTNKALRTLESSVWPISVSTLEILTQSGQKLTHILEQKVICQVWSDACYADKTAKAGFNIDVEAFTQGQEKVTGKKVNFINLWERLFTIPHF